MYFYTSNWFSKIVWKAFWNKEICGFCVCREIFCRTYNLKF